MVKQFFRITIILVLLSPLAAIPAQAGSPLTTLLQYPTLYSRPNAPQNPDSPIQIIMVGDTSMARGVEAMAQQHGLSYPFANVQEWLQTADMAVANYEGVIAADGIGQMRYIGYRLRAQPDATIGLLQAGFKLFNLANNHTMDWGPDGLKATLDNMHHDGLLTVGAGSDGPTARTALVTPIRGIKIVWLSFTMVPDPPDYNRDREDSWTRSWFGPTYAWEKLAALVKDAKKLGDVLIVQFHWGNEYTPCPTDWQLDLGRAAIRAGASLVIGHHPHVVQPFEAFEGGFIAYSLGNFVFDQPRTPGMALWIRIDAKGVIDVRGLTLVPGVQPEWKSPQQASRDFQSLCRLDIARTKK